VKLLESKIKEAFSYLQRDWDGREYVEETKEIGHNTGWRQMKWIGFYFQTRAILRRKARRARRPGDNGGRSMPGRWGKEEEGGTRNEERNGGNLGASAAGRPCMGQDGFGETSLTCATKPRQ
jgi:hypothetical protein